MEPWLVISYYLRATFKNTGKHFILLNISTINSGIFLQSLKCVFGLSKELIQLHALS